MTIKIWREIINDERQKLVEMLMMVRCKFDELDENSTMAKFKKNTVGKSNFMRLNFRIFQGVLEVIDAKTRKRMYDSIFCVVKKVKF